MSSPGLRVVGSLLLVAVVACSGTGADPTTTSSEPITSTTMVTTTTSSVETTTTAPTTTTTPPEFPDDLETLEHGGEVWAVVLAGSTEFTDPALGAAVVAAGGAGYKTGPTDCDLGAAAALGQPEESNVYTVSVYFADQETANRALEAFEARSTSGVVTQVQTFCLD